MQPCIPGKGPYILAKAPWVSDVLCYVFCSESRPTHIPAKEPCIPAKEPCIPAKAPWVSDALCSESRPTHIPTKEPCIPTKEPCISARARARPADETREIQNSSLMHVQRHVCVFSYVCVFVCVWARARAAEETHEIQN